MSVVIRTNSVPFTLHLTETAADLQAMGGEWNELFTLAVNPTASLSHAWVNEWWKIFAASYAPAPSRLLVISLRKDDKLVAIIPLYLQITGSLNARILRFISAGSKDEESLCPEYLDILHDGKEPLTYLGYIGDFLTGLSDCFDQIDFGIVRRNSLVCGLAERLAGSRMWLKSRPVISLQADIKGGLDAYSGRLSSSGRTQARRLLKQKDLELSVIEDTEEALHCFNELVTLHQRKWESEGKTGAFSSDYVRLFHKNLITQLMPGRQLSLIRLSYRDKPLSILYGFLIKDRFEFYQSGIDTSIKSVKSPGITAHLLAMEALSAKGFRQYDFLCGESTYKRRLATQQSECLHMQLHRPSVRSAISFTHSSCRRLIAKVNRLQSLTKSAWPGNAA